MEWRDFSELSTAKQLKEYFVIQWKHTTYCHYTELGVLEKILSKKQFWVSPVKRFNDKKDSAQFEEQNYCFSLCFSTGVNENLALWYLYSGVDGKGGRISFTASKIEQMIKKGKYTLCQKIDNNELREICVLENDDCEIKFEDILYFREKDNEEKVSLKYNTMTNYKVSKDEFNKYRKENSGFFKGLIWYYEKETRLLIRLKGEIRRKIEENKEYVIILDFNHLKENDYKIKLAPEITSIEEIEDKPNIKKANDVKEIFSEYKGDVEMRLCDKCKKCENCQKKEKTK